jgi:hypothetical protein
MTLSFLADGGVGCDVYDEARKVGWVRPQSVGLCGLSSERAAIAAAASAYRALARLPEASVLYQELGTLAIRHVDRHEYITDGRILVARLYRPSSIEPGEVDGYAIELPADHLLADRPLIGSVTRAWRAMYSEVQSEEPMTSPAR